MALTQRQNDRPEEAIRDLGQMLEDGRFRNETAVRYGMALAQIRANRLADAGATLDRLLGIHPEVVEFIVSRAGRGTAVITRVHCADLRRRSPNTGELCAQRDLRRVRTGHGRAGALGSEVAAIPGLPQ